MGWLLLFLCVAVAGIVAGVRWVAPWARRIWPAWLVKAVFGSVLVLACWGAPTEPLVAQSPDVVAHEVSDTSAGLWVRWNRPSGDSVQAKTAGCYRVKVNGQAWGRWSCRYLTEPRMAVSGTEPPPPPVDSQPVPPDTVPTPPDTMPPPPPPSGTLSSNAFRTVGDAGTGLPWLWRGGQVVADPKMGTALQFTYPAGKTGGTAPGNVWIDEGVLKASALPSVTFDGWLWVSANWQGHLTNTNKAAFIGFGVGGNQLIVNLYGKGAGPLTAVLQFQGMASLPATASPWIVKPNCGAAGCAAVTTGKPFSRGAWHRITVTADASGATLALDGQAAAIVTGVRWTASPFYLAKLALNPTWGGGGDKVLSTMQLRWAGVTVAR